MAKLTKIQKLYLGSKVLHKAAYKVRLRHARSHPTVSQTMRHVMLRSMGNLMGCKVLSYGLHYGLPYGLYRATCNNLWSYTGAYTRIFAQEFWTFRILGSGTTTIGFGSKF